MAPPSAQAEMSPAGLKRAIRDEPINVPGVRVRLQPFLEQPPAIGVVLRVFGLLLRQCLKVREGLPDEFRVELNDPLVEGLRGRGRLGLPCRRDMKFLDSAV